ncbi:hypothetical protein ACOMHN_001983 [Nucella lapillus]
MSGFVRGTMLMGAPSQMDDLFLPAHFAPSSLAQELREDMQQDTSTTSTTTHYYHHHHPEPPSHHHHHHPPPDSSYPAHDDDASQQEEEEVEKEEGGTTTRILVDALVTTPTPTTRWYQASLTSVFVTVLVLGGVALGRGYVRMVLLWLQGEGVGVGLLIFTCLFFLISFPLFWGYALLLLAAGYLYGCVRGPLVALSCTGVALGVANSVMRTCCHALFMDKLYSGKARAILRVLNSPQGIKIVALTRLTPIPFGLQNALFSLSDMNQARYVVASVLGLCPMAALYCYMGSTLRSMEDVLTDSSSHLTGYLILGGQVSEREGERGRQTHRDRQTDTSMENVLTDSSSHLTGYLILGGQMVFTAVLLCFVVRKARGELKKAMEQSTPGPPQQPDIPSVVVD